MTLTLWRTEQAARASDVAAEQSRARTVGATGVELLEHTHPAMRAVAVQLTAFFSSLAIFASWAGVKVLIP